MAASVSIRINESDIRERWGIEVLNAGNQDIGRFDIAEFKPIVLRGSEFGTGKQEAKTLRMVGEIKASSHANLLSAMDDFKTEVTGQYAGLKEFRIAFEDDSNKYYMARTSDLRFNPIGPRFNCEAYQLSWTIEIADPAAIYDTLSLTDATGSPFSSPVSIRHTNSGSAITKPRIVAENTTASDIDSLEILNTACVHRQKLLLPTVTNLEWTDGRWGDVRGAIHYGLTGSFSVPCKGNFHPASFTFTCFVRFLSLAATGYVFSTTGDIIYLRYTTGAPGQWDFEVNGTKVSIQDIVSSFAINDWWQITVSYDGTTAILTMHKIGAADGAFFTEDDTPSAYNGLPTSLFVGTKADGSTQGNKDLDDVRIYNRIISGMSTSVAYGAERLELFNMPGPLPIAQGVMTYFPFDYNVNGSGWENTDLTITATLAQDEYYEINCDRNQVHLVTVAPSNAPVDKIADTAGEFPILTPGMNGIQIIHDGDASALNFAIEDKRAYV